MGALPILWVRPRAPHVCRPCNQQYGGANTRPGPLAWLVRLHHVATAAAAHDALRCTLLRWRAVCARHARGHVARMRGCGRRRVRAANRQGCIGVVCAKVRPTRGANHRRCPKPPPCYQGTRPLDGTTQHGAVVAPAEAISRTTIVGRSWYAHGCVAVSVWWDIADGGAVCGVSGGGADVRTQC